MIYATSRQFRHTHPQTATPTPFTWTPPSIWPRVCRSQYRRLRRLHGLDATHTRSLIVLMLAAGSCADRPSSIR